MVQRAFRSTQTIEELAQRISDEKDDAAILSLGLQLYLVVDSASNKIRGLQAFRELFHLINHEKLADAIISEFDDRYQGDLPFTRVVFDHETTTGVQLPEEAEGYAFRLYRSGQITIVRNTGDNTLWLGGHALLSGQLVRLRTHQPKQQNETRSLYIHESSSGLIAERSKSRQSTLKITFGIKTIIRVLRNTEILVAGNIPAPRTELTLGLSEKLTLSDGKKVSLEHLRRQAMEAGGRFRLDQGEQTIVASNDPTVLKKGDLLLSPGLAGKVILKIKFD